jgi:hypothetical protein
MGFLPEWAYNAASWQSSPTAQHLEPDIEGMQYSLSLAQPSGRADASKVRP